jgi:hypothetical protein
MLPWENARLSLFKVSRGKGMRQRMEQHRANPAWDLPEFRPRAAGRSPIAAMRR